MALRANLHVGAAPEPIAEARKPPRGGREARPPPRAARPTGTPTPSQISVDSVGPGEHPLCLMCGAANPLGLKLAFTVQRDGAVLARVPSHERFQGYPGILHGGFISALLDAAMTNALFSIGVVGLTAELTVRFLSPVPCGRGAHVRARVERRAGPLYFVRAELELRGKPLARASAKFLARTPRSPSPVVPRAPRPSAPRCSPALPDPGLPDPEY